MGKRARSRQEAAKGITEGGETMILTDGKLINKPF